MHKSFRHISGSARPLALATLSLAVAAGLALPMGAHASAFQLKEDSAKAMGRAYAGSATAGNDVSVASLTRLTASATRWLRVSLRRRRSIR